MKQCAFLSMDSLENFVVYDQLLFAPLHALGWQAREVSWRDTRVDWNDFDAVIIRSCWDYQQDPQAFFAVLETIDRSSARLENDLSLVRWNLDKRYLRDLESAGIPIVPTHWMDAYSASDVASYFDACQSDEIIIKPTISAGADNTFRLNRQQAKTEKSELEKIFSQRSHMLQPFIQNIVNEGEYSIFFFGGQYSHAILKKPKAEDFRVQEEHGGLLSLIEPEASLLTASHRVLAQIQPQPLYARVDLVRYQTGFVLMELEIIEPSLYFNMDPESPARFARCFKQWMAEKSQAL